MSRKPVKYVPSTIATGEQIQAAARQRLRRALDHIQQAQDHISSAQEELSALRGAAPEWRAAHKLHDRIRAFWYRVESVQIGGNFTLDEGNVGALERHIAARKQEASNS